MNAMQSMIVDSYIHWDRCMSQLISLYRHGCIGDVDFINETRRLHAEHAATTNDIVNDFCND